MPEEKTNPWVELLIEVEAQPHPIITVLNQIRRKILSIRVGKSNKTNKYRNNQITWLIQ